MKPVEIHSVVLNLNKNYSNNKAFDFSTIVNKQLNLKPNSMVALYTGNIVRKPIVLATDASFQINFNQALNNRYSEAITGHNFHQNIESTGSIEISAGEYSKLAFCKLLCDSVNVILQGFDYTETGYDAIGNGQSLYACIPYRMTYSMRDGDFFVGLRYKLPEQQEQAIVGSSNILEPNWNLTTIMPLDDGCTSNSGLTKTGGSTGNPHMLSFNRTTRANNWDAYALGNSALRPMASMIPAQQLEYTSESLIDDVSFTTINLKGSRPGSGSQGQEFFWGLNNTYFSSSWAQAGTTVATDTIPDLGVTVPQSLLGAYFALTVDNTDGYTSQLLYVTMNRMLAMMNLEDFDGEISRDQILLEGQKTIAQIDLAQYNVDLETETEFKWIIYSAFRPNEPQFNPTDDTDDNIPTLRQYYFRLQVTSPYEQGLNAILFDSRQYGIFIPQEVVDLGWGFQGLPNPDDATKFVSGGLCPQYYFKNTNTDLKVSNPMGNYVTGSYTDDNHERNLVLFTGESTYEMQVLENDSVTGDFKTQTDLQNILGIAENESDNSAVYTHTAFDPNVFPIQRELGGITQLGSDRTRYNIELNLPVSAYNSTESKANDIGQKRAILYHTNPIVEDVTNVSSGLVNKNLEPNTLKYLSLNNEAEIKLNTLDIKIRRAKTNQLADEITDCTIELLIQN